MIACMNRSTRQHACGARHTNCRAGQPVQPRLPSIASSVFTRSLHRRMTTTGPPLASEKSAAPHEAVHALRETPHVPILGHRLPGVEFGVYRVLDNQVLDSINTKDHIKKKRDTFSIYFSHTIVPTCCPAKSYIFTRSEAYFAAVEHKCAPRRCSFETKF